MCPGRTSTGVDPLLRVVEIRGEGWEEQGHCGSQSTQRLGKGLGITGSLWFSVSPEIRERAGKNKVTVVLRGSGPALPQSHPAAPSRGSVMELNLNSFCGDTCSGGSDTFFFPPPGPPFIVSPPENITVNISQDALFTCQAEAYPGNLTYLWYWEEENVYFKK